MPLDMLLINAFLSLTPQQTAQNKNRIADALENGQTDIYIPGMRTETVTLSVDYVVLMFNYSWEYGNGYAPYFTRQPKPENYDQSSPDYGNRSLALASQYGIDVMVGHWNGDLYNPNDKRDKNLFNNFRNSISQYTGAFPKIAYSMEFEDARAIAVQKHIDFLWGYEFNQPRYCRIFDRDNKWRFPVIFWGVKEVGPPNAPASNDHIMALGKLLKDLKLRRTNDGAQAYVIWHSQMLDRYLYGNQHNKLFRTEVIDRIDAVYQHEIQIPTPSKAITWRQNNKDWKTFPHTELDPVNNLNETRNAQLEIERNGFVASDGFPLLVIPGCMPQFSRERYAYHLEQDPNGLDEKITTTRVNCTDINQLTRTLQSMQPLAETYRLIRNGLSWTAKRMVALTSWNEWREGTTWEPGAADGNDPQIFGITDTNGQFLSQAKRAFSTQTITYRIGDLGSSGGGGEPDPEPRPRPRPRPGPRPEPV